MLWLAIHFTHLPLEAQSGWPDGPCAVSEGGQLICLNPAAQAAGLSPGLRQGSALALLPSLQIRPRDQPAERAALEALAAWAGQFTSCLALEAPAHLLLDIGGSLRLFGGARPLLTQVQQGLQALNYRHALAAAPSPSGARLLARCRPGGLLTRHADLRTALANEPLEQLELSARVLGQMRAVGIRSLGECLSLPRAGLRRRYGAAVLNHLDRLLGLAPDPRESFRPPLRWHRRLELATESEHCEALLFGYRRLFVELEGFLRGRDCGVLRLHLQLEHAEQQSSRLSLGLAAPGRDAMHWLGLLRERFERTPLTAPVRAIALEADDFSPLQAPQASLLPAVGSRAADRQGLLERLAARLGPSALWALQTHADHRPEQASRRCAPGEGGDLTGERQPRPLWLLPKPEPVDPAGLQVRGSIERLETGWWDGGDTGRDYHRARDRQGRELWIFRTHDQPPRWFLHGIFG